MQADPENNPLVLHINFLSILTLNAEPKTVRQARMPSVTLPCLFVVVVGVVVVVAQATIGQVKDRGELVRTQTQHNKTERTSAETLPAHQIKHFFWHWAINFAVCISEIISISVLVHVGSAGGGLVVAHLIKYQMVWHHFKNSDLFALKKPSEEAVLFQYKGYAMEQKLIISFE